MRQRCREAGRDCACDDDVARLIALATTMSRGSKRSGSQQRCREAYCSCDDDVARLVEIALEDVDNDRDQNNNNSNGNLILLLQGW